ncbi:spermidine/putrescine-binding periplasmic protein [Oceanicola granulosus HTCC2516]|uniref:Spermidine/putrescine-binding periplasmic protein n=1 Tax=Oceanicola granulosus (strain ATCC BAA-861 / DSM 15982 / KCTC 12143 / HTCC2516) TaxID=314256 RepID=Q2CF53_OCEGH|nr:extracellular solute-binding protein [Oceanicola granulosus]EAR51274.1 spermidine/putrescine-binding periplasmic protein [Oceanicola granulosus HTCC2516]
MPRYQVLLLAALETVRGLSGAYADELTVATWGGIYQLSQKNAYAGSFEDLSGFGITWVEYQGGLDEVRDQVARGEIEWDVVDVLGQDARQGCADGLFLRLPDDLFPVEIIRDLVMERPNDCVGPNITWSWVTAYDTSAFPAAPPASVADFFDVAAFPGPRAIAAWPQANLEMALLADGVRPGEVYPLLRTEAGQDRAFSVLSRIAADLRFWSSGEEPVALLLAGDVVMSTAYNGRVAAAQLAGETRIGAVYEGQILDEEWFAIVAGTPNEAAALAFLRHVAAPEQQAAQARWIPYGPMRRSALAIIAEGEPWFHTGQPVLPHIPSRTDRLEDALVLDPDFWVEHGDALTARFARWRRGLGL